MRRPEEREVLRDRGEQGLGVQSWLREAEARLDFGQTSLDGRGRSGCIA